MNRNTMTNEDAGIRVSAQLQHQDERPVEEWSSAGIGNAFLFGKVMTANPDLLLEDGVTKIVLNAAGHKGDISTDLREFLQMVSKNPEPGLYAEGSFADRVQKQVHIARRNAKWRKEYMDWEMTLRNEYEKGRERERVHTEEQRKRADAAEERADVAEKRIGAAEERADAAEKRIDAAEERAAKAEEENRRLKEQLANLQKAK